MTAPVRRDSGPIWVHCWDGVREGRCGAVRCKNRFRTGYLTEGGLRGWGWGLFLIAGYMTLRECVMESPAYPRDLGKGF